MLIADWKEMVDRKIQMMIKEKNATSGLDLSARPPFTLAIMNYEHLTKFRPPNLDPYDETKDHVNHV